VKQCIEVNQKEIFISNLDKRNYSNILYNPAPELMSSSFLNYGSSYNQNMIDNSINMTDNKPQDQKNITLFPLRENNILNIKKNENIDILSILFSRRGKSVIFF